MHGLNTDVYGPGNWRYHPRTPRTGELLLRLCLPGPE